MGEKIFVFDLECACWMGHPPAGMRNDIIEIGFCVLDVATSGITERRSLIVRPSTANISDFCTKTTGISRERAAKGMSLEEACGIMVECGSKEMMVGAWGRFDFDALKTDCKFYGVEFPLESKQVNAQLVFKRKRKLGYQSSVKGALALLGREFDGRPHSAADDAYNTAVIMSEVLCEAVEP